MANCPKCGAEVDAETKFCPACGAAIEEATAAPIAPVAPAADNANAGAQQNANTQQNANAQQGAKKGFFDTPDITAECNPNDIADNKVMGILSYIGFLWLIPLFAAQNSKFSKFHANQGLLLFICEAAYGIISIVLQAVIKIPVYVWGYYTGSYTPGWLTAILSLLGLVFTAAAVLGIINAAQGKAKELPLIGKFRIIKY